MTSPSAVSAVTTRAGGATVAPVRRASGVRVLNGSVLTAAIVLAVAGALLPLRRPETFDLTPVAGAGITLLLVAVAQFARLRFRVGRGAVSVSWGEAAFLLGFVLAPPGWLPAITLTGVAAAWLLLTWLDDQRALADLVHLAASLSLGTTGAVAVAYAIIGPDAPLSATRTQVGLVAGATTHLVITLGLAVLTLALHRDASPVASTVRALHAKLPMFVGNVLVGFFILYAAANGPLWLLGLPAVLWLLQRTYRHHLRAEEERRTWEAFARATRTLAGRTEAEVAAAGLSGALDVFGARRAEITLPAGTAIGDAQDRQYVCEAAPEAHQGSAPGPVITRAMSVGGTPVGDLTVWLAESALPAAQDEPAVSAFADVLAGALHDAAAHERIAALDARLAHDGVHDQVTGLANRSALLADGDALLASLERDLPVAVLLLDLNDFREINSTLGYRAGDDVLRLVAERLTALSREGELIARLGDDEFAMLLPTVTTLTAAAGTHEAPSPLPQAVRRAREVIDAVGRPIDAHGVRLVTDVAVGVVVERAGYADLGELIRRASVALDQAKELNVPVAAYDGTRDATSTDHLAMPAELLDALDAQDQLVLMLQPEVDLATGAPTGVEALIRWMHPRRGLLGPDTFVRTAENGELLGPFTRYVLDRALHAAADWAAAGVADVPVSVNISARSLLDPTFPAQVGEALRRHRTVPDLLVLEVTESLAVSDSVVVDEVIAALRDLGVQISVDDFGTGFSSLAFVTRVTVDELKVDRSFVTGMTDSPAAAAIVRGAVELGARLGARVVAEGVETADQRAALLDMGCTTAQGYHFSRPLPADKIVRALHQLADAAPARVVPLRIDGAS